MVIEKFCVALGLMPLFAVTVPVNTPPTVGVPDRTPAVESVSPPGKAPAVTENDDAG